MCLLNIHISMLIVHIINSNIIIISIQDITRLVNKNSTYVHNMIVPFPGKQPITPINAHIQLQQNKNINQWQKKKTNRIKTNNCF